MALGLNKDLCPSCLDVLLQLEDRLDTERPLPVELADGKRKGTIRVNVGDIPTAQHADANHFMAFLVDNLGLRDSGNSICFHEIAGQRS